MQTNTILPASPFDEPLRVCDRQHHYFHYQSSAQYLWLARTYDALGEYEEAKNCYDKAIFQDHLNMEAIEGKQYGHQGIVTPPKYDKHPSRDRDFCAAIGQPVSSVTLVHDQGVLFMETHQYEKAFLCFDAAVYESPEHSNSYFGRGKCQFIQQQFVAACSDFREAIRLSHHMHDSYHRNASDLHAQRARWFETQGEMDLAIADYSKALDLFRQNRDVRLSRSALYRKKGNVRMAEEDLLRAQHA